MRLPMGCGDMYETILFDIDGVLLSEESYFDASGLTVWELLASPQYVGCAPAGLPQFPDSCADVDGRALRRTVFADDAVLRAFKGVGVNANWDMVYLQTSALLVAAVQHVTQRLGERAVQQALAGPTACGWSPAALNALGCLLRQAQPLWQADFAIWLRWAQTCADKAALLQTVASALQHACPGLGAFAEGGRLWNVCRTVFQTWYLGADYATDACDKPGFLTREQALVDAGQFATQLARWKERGLRLGIATGRPATETQVPLAQLGWLPWFESERITTATDVLAAQALYPAVGPLSKPHPYSYVRSLLAGAAPGKVLSTALPLPAARARRVLIVGDSVADQLAAQAIGCDFAAVLTGLDGERARTAFERAGATYVVGSVSELCTALSTQ